jgi:RNA polymerase sigma-70 factor (ECF subfamily)
MRDILGKDLVRRYEQRLSPDQRRVIELHFFGGHPFDEVAEIVGMSVTNVRSHYYRALERLRRYVLPEDFGAQ